MQLGLSLFDRDVSINEFQNLSEVTIFRFFSDQVSLRSDTLKRLNLNWKPFSAPKPINLDFSGLKQLDYLCLGNDRFANTTIQTIPDSVRVLQLENIETDAVMVLPKNLVKLKLQNTKIKFDCIKRQSVVPGITVEVWDVKTMMTNVVEELAGAIYEVRFLENRENVLTLSNVTQVQHHHLKRRKESFSIQYHDKIQCEYGQMVTVYRTSYLDVYSDAMAAQHQHSSSAPADLWYKRQKHLEQGHSLPPLPKDAEKILRHAQSQQSLDASSSKQLRASPSHTSLDPNVQLQQHKQMIANMDKPGMQKESQISRKQHKHSQSHPTRASVMRNQLRLNQQLKTATMVKVIQSCWKAYFKTEILHQYPDPTSSYPDPLLNDFTSPLTETQSGFISLLSKFLLEHEVMKFNATLISSRVVLPAPSHGSGKHGQHGNGSELMDGVGKREKLKEKIIGVWDGGFSSLIGAADTTHLQPQNQAQNGNGRRRNNRGLFGGRSRRDERLRAEAAGLAAAPGIIGQQPNAVPMPVYQPPVHGYGEPTQVQQVVTVLGTPPVERRRAGDRLRGLLHHRS
ncbi:unnamed protein product [Ambrosiozyma monospora]|uniref:Unnamed protein product n=1 Tax=Ambrosiozyma monospora TaxID=43982 RepID=A0ACB5T0Z8_AMBMO|nr:unnamed protein product [Ambrosiozyma monospora]